MLPSLSYIAVSEAKTVEKSKSALEFTKSKGPLVPKAGWISNTSDVRE